MDKVGKEILNNMIKLDILNFKDAETTARFNNGGFCVSATGRDTDMLILSLVLAKKILKETGYSSEKYCKTLERALLEDGEGSGVEEMMDIFSDIFMEGVIEWSYVNK